MDDVSERSTEDKSDLSQLSKLLVGFKPANEQERGLLLRLFPEPVPSEPSQPSQVSLELSASAIDSNQIAHISAMNVLDSQNSNAVTVTANEDYASFAEVPVFKKRRRD